jgi:hypothetical protein
MRTIQTEVLLAVYFCFFASAAVCAPEFKVQNPDGKKYEFARSYITALSYFHHIEDRWRNQSPQKLYAGRDQKIIKANINYLAMDNADLRIAKNYMVPYLTAQNTLIRKVADLLVVACDQKVGVNNEQKILWEKWSDLKAAGQATDAKEKEFIKTQESLAFKVKEKDKDIIQASVLLTKVLISASSDEHGHQLAITDKQREKLLDKLDSFGKGALDWGLKPGQSTLEASIAVIREVLEDSIWISLK